MVATHTQVTQQMGNKQPRKVVSRDEPNVVHLLSLNTQCEQLPGRTAELSEKPRTRQRTSRQIASVSQSVKRKQAFTLPEQPALSPSAGSSSFSNHQGAYPTRSRSSCLSNEKYKLRQRSYPPRRKKGRPSSNGTLWATILPQCRFADGPYARAVLSGRGPEWLVAPELRQNFQVSSMTGRRAVPFPLGLNASIGSPGLTCLQRSASQATRTDIQRTAHSRAGVALLQRTCRVPHRRCCCCCRLPSRRRRPNPAPSAAAPALNGGG